MFWKSAMPPSSYPSSSSSPSSSIVPAGAGRGLTILENSNLDRFLDCVTPCLPLHFLPRSCIYGIDANWLPVGNEPVPYFKLANLWQGFDQASAYGVGSRVLFDDGDVVTQYYSPFLSAIQLFTDKPYASASGKVVSRSDSDISWSDENESEKFSKSLSSTSSPTCEAYMNGIAENRSSLASDKRGYTYLNYCEFASPFWRIPFYEKIMELAHTHPELLTLSSIELSPLSWMAVVWYPIYNIPSQTRSKDLSTVFLTFYNLCPSSLGDGAYTESNGKSTVARKNLEQKEPKEGKKDMICLSPFGLSTFKLSGNTWTKNQSDVKRLSCLQSAADSWLKQLSFFHHDFIFYLNQQPSEEHK